MYGLSLPVGPFYPPWFLRLGGSEWCASAVLSSELCFVTSGADPGIAFRGAIPSFLFPPLPSPSPPFSFPSPPFLSLSFPPPPLPSLRSRTPYIQLGSLGSAVSSPSGIRAEPRPKMDLVHCRAVRKPLVAIISSILN